MVYELNGILMLTVLSRISGDIINYVGAMNWFYCPCFWESKVKIRFPSLEILWEKWNNNLCTFFPPRLLQRLWVLNEAKNWAKGNSYLMPNFIQNWGAPFSSRFLLVGRGKEWSASASSCGCSDQSSLKGQMLQQ